MHHRFLKLLFAIFDNRMVFNSCAQLRFVYVFQYSGPLPHMHALLVKRRQTDFKWQPNVVFLLLVLNLQSIYVTANVIRYFLQVRNVTLIVFQLHKREFYGNFYHQWEMINKFNEKYVFLNILFLQENKLSIFLFLKWFCIYNYRTVFGK